MKKCLLYSASILMAVLTTSACADQRAISQPVEAIAFNTEPVPGARELMQRIRAEGSLEGQLLADNRRPTTEVIPAEEVIRKSQEKEEGEKQPKQKAQAASKEQRYGNWTVLKGDNSTLYTITNPNGDSFALTCRDGMVLSKAQLGNKIYQSGNPHQQIVIMFNNDPDRVLLQSDWEQAPKILWIAFRINTVFSISTLEDPAAYKFDNAGGRRVTAVAQADPECIAP